MGALQPLQVAFFGDLGPGYDQACVDEVMTGGQLTLELVTVEGVRAVRASLSASLYEGSSRLGCGYTATGLDLDDFQSTSVLARAGEGPVPLYLSLLNSRRRTSEADRNGGDKATFHLNVEALSCFSPGGSP